MFWMQPGDGLWSLWIGGWGVLWCQVAVAVAVALWVASRSGGSQVHVDRSHIDALRILEQRYGRGEIDRAEYDARRATLRAQR